MKLIRHQLKVGPIYQIQKCYVWQSIRDRFFFESSDEKNKQKEYMRLVGRLKGKHFDKEQVELVMQEIKQEIQRVINKCYENDNIHKLLKHQTSDRLSLIAIQHFVGSFSSPRNPNLYRQIMEMAKDNAKSEKEFMRIEYIELYLKKILAIESGDIEMFDEVNNQLIDLSQKGQPQAMHLVAKEMYKMSQNMKQQKYKKDKKQLIQESYKLFVDAGGLQNWDSFYYIGQMSEEGDIPGGIDIKYAYECYLISASHGSPQSYFKLAQLYSKGIVIKKNPDLQYLYTLKAAELGMVEAMHNLGVQYLEGKIVEYDSMKAASWFNRASQFGFTHSSYNLAKLFYQGASDNRVKKDYHIALHYFLLCDQAEKFDSDHKKFIQSCQKQIEIEKQHQADIQ